MQYYLAKLNNDSVEGLEDLSLSERFKLGFKNLSLDIDKKLSTFNESVHTVNANEFKNVLYGRNYLKESDKLIATPGIWTPKSMSFKEYVHGVNQGFALFSMYKTDLEEFYNWLKQIATKSKVPMTFKYRITNTDKLIEQQYQFIKKLKTELYTEKAPVKALYANYNDFLGLVGDYNTQAKLIKARDPEVVAKQISLNANLGEITLKKIEAGDVSLTKDEIEKIKEIFSTYEHYTNVVGASLGLINELPAVFEQQLKDIQSF